MPNRLQDRVRLRTSPAGLILTGGGARAAYQVGVLRTGARWLTLMSVGWLVRRSLRARPKSLLDNSPLQALLGRMIELERLQRSLEHGHLRALAVGASSYSSGRHVTFYQALNDYQIPNKLQRLYVRCGIHVDHLLASSAIPFIFPAVSLDLALAGAGGVEHFGDGSIRQLSPISPAIHLGAERVLVVGVGQVGHPGLLPGVDGAAYPTLAQMAGHAMSSIFLDSLASDLERLDKMNQISAALSPQERLAIGLREVETLVISP